jgi:hypothetical protein
MHNTRRDVLKFAGGTALGALFTPVPWRLITDTAIWSENWPGIPRPARGEIRSKFTHCSLCDAGCAVRARCVGEQPISLAGVASNPLSRGVLCPLGLTGHHLPFHPDRVTRGPAEEAAAAAAQALARRGAGERAAILDLRPRRTVSWTYRRAMKAVSGGAYLAPSEPALAVNLAEARTVLSLGVPLLEAWGTPGTVLAARERFRLIQADALESRTGSMADLWLRIHAGTEGVLAGGIAGALKPGKGIPPAEAARITGIEETRIAALAVELVSNGPSLVLDSEASPEVLELNLLLGNWGRTLVPRPEAPVPDAWRKSAAPVETLESVADRSIRLLLIDESAPGDYLPWRAVEKKLVREGAVVIAFAWSKSGYGRHANFVLPAAVYPEALDDIPAADDSPAACFRLAAPLTAGPAGVTSPAAFVARLAGMEAGDALRERADAIHRTGRGNLLAYATGASTPIKEVKPDDFWKTLNEGGCWVADAAEKAPPPEPAEAAPARPVEAADLPLVAALDARSPFPGSPLLSKLDCESGLRLGPEGAAVHPQTAAAAGLAEGGRAVLQTAFGRCGVDITIDPGVPPGVVGLAARPEILDLCSTGARVKVVRA